MKYFLFLLFTAACFSGYSQSDIEGVKKTMADIFDRDQKTRTGKDSADFIHFIDSTNLVEVEAIIKKHGWLKKSVYGRRANQTCFLVIQHADSATQEKYLPVMQKSVDEGESSSSDLALLQDRVLMRRGEKQIYGSQVVFDADGTPAFYPIEDEMNVNSRRKNVGLEPIEKYAEYFGIDYKAPKK